MLFFAFPLRAQQNLLETVLFLHPPLIKTAKIPQNQKVLSVEPSIKTTAYFLHSPKVPKVN